MGLRSFLVSGILASSLWAANPPGLAPVMQPQERPTVWPESLPDFVVESLRQAQESDKPVLVGFGAGWCLPCKAMEQSVLPDPRVAGELKNWITIKIDKDKYPDLARSFSVTGLPTYYILDPKGQVVDKKAGMQLAIDFAEWLSDNRNLAR